MKLEKVKRYFKNYTPRDLCIRQLKPFIKRAMRKKIEKEYARLKAMRDFPRLKENSARSPRVIVSLTSFPARLDDVSVAIKSVLLQKRLPDKIILYLGTDCDGIDLPDDLLELKKFGLEIKTGCEDLKPHKKYFYAMQEHPDDIIITIDDDIIFDKNLVKDLLSSFKKHPRCVSAARVNRINCDEGGVLPYKKFDLEYTSVKKPSHSLLATTGGGTLYPPRVLPKEAFDAERIKALALNADDFWIKFILLKTEVPVVLCSARRVAFIPIPDSQKASLASSNVEKNENDKTIKLLEKEFGISLKDFGHRVV